MKARQLVEEPKVDPAKLWQYARDGNLAAVKAALAAGADVHVFKDAALRYAADNCHLAVVKLLLQHGADVHAFDDEALRYAAYNGRLPVVQLLLQHGAAVHANNDDALRNAAYYGHLPVVQLLLQHGADVHAFNDAALRYAAYYGHLPVVQLLLQHGADLSVLTKEQLQKLNLSNQDLKGLAKHALGESRDPLIDAVLDNDLAAIKARLKRSLSQPLLDNVACIAAYNGLLEAFKLLVEAGANITSTNEYAFRRAAQNGHAAVVKYILSKTNPYKFSIDTALVTASAGGHTEVVRLLAPLAFDLSRPLKAAAKRGRKKVIDVLLAAGASLADLEPDELAQAGLDNNDLRSAAKHAFGESVARKLVESVVIP